MATVWGYARVSTSDQSVDMQIDALMAAGVDRSRILIDHGVSGAVRSRPALDDLLGRIQRNDQLIVYKLDRLGRSASHLLGLVERLDAGGVRLRVIGDGIDTGSATGRMILTVLAAMSEFERSILRERVSDGIAAARRRGQHLGRPHALTTEQVDHAAEQLRQGKSLNAVGRLLGVDKATVQRAVARRAQRQASS